MFNLDGNTDTWLDEQHKQLTIFGYVPYLRYNQVFIYKHPSYEFISIRVENPTVTLSMDRDDPINSPPLILSESRSVNSAIMVAISEIERIEKRIKESSSMLLGLSK